MAIQRVVNVVTADTRKDISALINAAAEHGFDPVGFLGGLIGESNLHERAVRENNPLDWSYGLSQPNLPYLHPDCGLPLTRNARGVVLHTAENIRLFREWAFDASRLIPYTARRYAELIRRFDTGGDPLRTWTRWNAPGRTLEQNEAAQPHAIANYRRGLAMAETFRATEQWSGVAGIIDIRGRLPTLHDRGNFWPNMDYDTRPVANIDRVVIHFSAGPDSGTIRAVAEHQISDAAIPQTNADQPFPAIAYHYAVKGDGLPHRLHDLTTRVWHAGAINASSVAIVYLGRGAPNEKQIIGMATCFVDAERQCGRLLTLSAHMEHGQTNCPELWPTWKAALIDEIERQR